MPSAPQHYASSKILRRVARGPNLFPITCGFVILKPNVKTNRNAGKDHLGEYKVNRNSPNTPAI